MRLLCLLAFAACEATTREGQPNDTEETGPVDTAVDTADTTDTAPVVELVDVSHARELRGLWVATAWNIDFPSRSGLSVSAQEAELATLVQRASDAGLNAIFFQVRPEGDALYASAHEPWSHVLTGTQGRDPGYDPLQKLIDLAHPRGIEVHAWLNPYRARAAASAQVAPHMAAVHPEVVYPYGSAKWMDPGAPVVRERLVDVVTDLVSSYDLDGVHFDDYFYPYPISGTPFPDTTTYNAHGGGLSKADWRRRNVNTAMQEVADAIEATDPAVRFGISPFGIYRPGQPSGVVGLDAYAELYADPLAWLAADNVDYLAPQLYWLSTSSGQPFDPLARWWEGQTRGRAHLFTGMNLTKLGEETGWTKAEYATQVRLSRSAGAVGLVFYNASPFLEDRQDVVAWMRQELFPTPALPPGRHGDTSAPRAPELRLSGGAVQITHLDPVPARAFTVYRDQGGAWTLDRVLPAASAAPTLPAGRWAVAAVVRGGAESRGVVVDIP